jgi:hypothetical protein
MSTFHVVNRFSYAFSISQRYTIERSIEEARSYNMEDRTVAFFVRKKRDPSVPLPACCMNRSGDLRLSGSTLLLAVVQVSQPSTLAFTVYRKSSQIPVTQTCFNVVGKFGIFPFVSATKYMFDMVKLQVSVITGNKVSVFTIKTSLPQHMSSFKYVGGVVINLDKVENFVLEDTVESYLETLGLPRIILPSPPPAPPASPTEGCLPVDLTEEPCSSSSSSTDDLEKELLDFLHSIPGPSNPSAPQDLENETFDSNPSSSTDDLEKELLDFLHSIPGSSSSSLPHDPEGDTSRQAEFEDELDDDDWLSGSRRVDHSTNRRRRAEEALEFGIYSPHTNFAGWSP